MRDQEPVYLRIGKGDSAVEFEFPVAENIQEEANYHYDELRENPYTMAQILASIDFGFAFTAKQGVDGVFYSRYVHQRMTLEDRIKRAKELQEAASNEVARLESLSFWMLMVSSLVPIVRFLRKREEDATAVKDEGSSPKRPDVDHLFKKQTDPGMGGGETSILFLLLVGWIMILLLWR